MNHSYLLFICTGILLAAKQTAAYIDPGTGSYVFQMIIAGALGSLFAIKMFWKRITGFFMGKKAKEEENNDAHLG